MPLGKYQEVFAENEIDFEVLPKFTEQDLEKLAIPLEPRKKLLKAIAVLSENSSGDAATDTVTEEYREPALAAPDLYPATHSRKNPELAQLTRRRAQTGYCRYPGLDQAGRAAAR